ncbi:GIY-YIG nuclease family protein [Alicyclobacillus mengziensis]|uniref:GIY-YIG nuclease family protein n=1 Tax=Alicyclobacillus mengziensis TaxID=2931921 RepID=A0A9X7W2J6_9BACL|nr:GIY-YIG nuclease family protein [Alicyclobacillus mengziensis]QSO49180.1 GIY-YIG nuclease family protein [Alicyclobacillus mengziensis]
MADYTSYIKYTEDNVRSNVPESGGVYKIGKEKPNDTSKVSVVYVGKSDNLQRRLLEHLSNTESNDCLKKKVSSGNLWIAWTVISGSAQRTAEETDRIEHFSPECNTQHNS